MMQNEIQKYLEILDNSIVLARNSASIENINEWTISAMQNNLPFGNYPRHITDKGIDSGSVTDVNQSRLRLI